MSIFRKKDGDAEVIEKIVETKLKKSKNVTLNSSGGSSGSIFNLGGGGTGIPGTVSGDVPTITATAVPYGATDGSLETEVTNLYYDSATDKFYAKRTTFESMYTNRTAKTADYTATSDDFQISIGTRAAVITITLPVAASNTNKLLVINDQAGLAGAYNVIVARSGSDLINGATSYTINTNNGTVALYSDGSNWYSLITSSSATAPVWTDVHARGTFAARPAASAGNAGYLYFETDGGPNSDGRMVRSNGASWETVAEVASSGTSGAGGEGLVYHPFTGTSPMPNIYFKNTANAVNSNTAFNTYYDSTTTGSTSDVSAFVPADATFVLADIVSLSDITIAGGDMCDLDVFVAKDNTTSGEPQQVLAHNLESTTVSGPVRHSNGGVLIPLNSSGEFSLKVVLSSGYSGTPSITVIAAVRGYFTGDASGVTSIVGITGTMAEFNTACTDGNFVYQGEALGTPSSGTATNLTGTAAGLTAGTVTTNANLTGEVTSVGNAATVTNSAVLAKILTGYTSGAGVVASTDTILQAIQKLNGNDATNANLTGVITSVGNATSIASQTGTGTKFVMDTAPTVTFLTLAAGTTTVPPLQLTAGVNLTVPVSGTIEFDGTDFYLTV